MSRKLPEGNGFFKNLLDAFPDPVFVVDREARIVEVNGAALRIAATSPLRALHKPPGDLMRCINSINSAAGCGQTFHCQDCRIRDAVLRAFNGRKVTRRRAKLEAIRNGKPVQMHLSITTSPFRYKDEQYVLLILEDISELVELKSILPICSHCKNIRDDQDFWDSVESYMKKHHDLDFSHGLCPDCIEKLYSRPKAAEA